MLSIFDDSSRSKLKMGRRYIGSKYTYRIDDRNYTAFKTWCSQRGIDFSSGIRGAIGYLIQKGSVKELLRDPEMLNLAKEIFENNLRGGK
jgi:hypothetical protein